MLGPDAASVVDPLLRRKYGWQRRLLELRARLNRTDDAAAYLEVAPADAAEALDGAAAAALQRGSAV